MAANRTTQDIIIDSAAFLVAAIYDPKHGIDVDALPLEVRDAVKYLREDLGMHLEPYRTLMTTDSDPMIGLVV